MHLRHSIIIGLTTILSGLIPISFNKKEISYIIYGNDIASSNMIKEELISFYKEHCYSSLFVDIDKKINMQINKMEYDVTYKDYTIIINSGDKIKMVGYLYKSCPPFINHKYYFNASTYSMPEAISSKVSTSTQSEYI